LAFGAAAAAALQGSAAAHLAVDPHEPLLQVQVLRICRPPATPQAMQVLAPFGASCLAGPGITQGEPVLTAGAGAGATTTPWAAAADTEHNSATPTRPTSFRMETSH
jgi:hypothetical protein